MAITFDQFKQLVTGAGLRFFEDTSHSRVMLGMKGMFGNYHIVMSLLDDGVFFQIRSVDNLACAKDHPHVAAVQQVIGALNTQYRLVKFAWDPSDGEIICYADLWIMDNTVTQQQFDRMLANYMPALDLATKRLKETLETGRDPGEQRPDTGRL